MYILPKHSQYSHNSFMKKSCFCQDKVFDSVTNESQFIKIPCGYTETEFRILVNKMACVMLEIFPYDNKLHSVND